VDIADVVGIRHDVRRIHQLRQFDLLRVNDVEPISNAEFIKLIQTEPGQVRFACSGKPDDQDRCFQLNKDIGVQLYPGKNDVICRLTGNAPSNAPFPLNEETPNTWCYSDDTSTTSPKLCAD